MSSEGSHNKSESFFALSLDIPTKHDPISVYTHMHEESNGVIWNTARHIIERFMFADEIDKIRQVI